MRPLFVSLLLLQTSFTIQAADWAQVARDSQRSIEIDRASVLPAEAGTKVAWARIVLNEAEAQRTGYRAVKALNRYDCRSQSFIVVKRVYLDANGLSLREEAASVQTPIGIKPGSLDERFFKEVCQPQSLNQLRKLALAAAAKAEQAAPSSATASMQHADLRLAKEEGAAPPTPPSTTPALPKAGSKPQLIELPAKLPRSASAPESSPQAASPPPLPSQTNTVPGSRELLRPRSYTPPPARKNLAPKAPSEALVSAHPPSAAAAARSPHEQHWSYEGEGGPQNWGRIKPEFATCSSGKRQSPIDIRDGIAVDLEPIQFDYRPSYFRIIDNGHTIQVNVGSGLRMMVMGRSYDLVQFHFHRPSEERIDGRAFDMVVHLVHKDLDGRLAVVGVLLERGSAHPLIQTLWNNLPLERNESYAPDNIAINPLELLPPERPYFTYMGSLTTPPCTEGVLWMVMKQPVQVSEEQIRVFARFYPHNARPIQGTAERTIKASR